MAKDFLDVNRGDTRRDKLRSVRVAKRVRRCPDIKSRLFPVHRNQFLDRPNRETATQTILKQRSVGRDVEPDVLIEGQKFHDARLSHFVEWDDPAARIFADRRRKMQVAPRTPVMIYQTDVEAGRFADAQAGVVHEQDQQVIPAAKGRSEVNGVEDATDFVF